MGTRIVSDPNDAAGTSLSSKCGALHRDLQASAAVTAKRVVSYGTNGKVATTATDGTPSLVAGIAVTTATAAGDTISVVFNGLVDDVPADGTIARGDLLKRSGTTAGYVAATATPAEGEVVGVAINDSASNVVDVNVGHAGGCGTA